MRGLLRPSALAVFVSITLAAGAGGAGAATVESHAVTDGGPHAISAGPGNSMIVGARDCGYLSLFDVGTGALTPVVPQGPSLPCMPGEAIFSTVLGPDARIYVTIHGPAAGNGLVGRVNTNGSSFETRGVPGHPHDLTVGPDGNVWFAVNNPQGKLGRITPADFPDLASVTTFPAPGDVHGPRGVISGPDGNLYVTGGEADKVWRVSPAAPGTFTEVGSAIDGPSFGEVGPDGNIWFAALEGSRLVRLVPATGAATQFTVEGAPWDVAFGDDGNAYVTDVNASSITQFNPATGATVQLATPAPATFIDEGPDGHLYAASPSADAVLEITPDTVAPDTTPPETTITKKPKKRTTKKRARFKFASSEAGSTFECKLDRKPYKRCTSPFRKKVKLGKHKFKVRATDAAGNVDPTPAKARFKRIDAD